MHHNLCMVPMGFRPREKSFNQRNVELYVNVWFEKHTIENTLPLNLTKLLKVTALCHATVPLSLPLWFWDLVLVMSSYRNGWGAQTYLYLATQANT